MPHVSTCPLCPLSQHTQHIPAHNPRYTMASAPLTPFLQRCLLRSSINRKRTKLKRAWVAAKVRGMQLWEMSYGTCKRVRFGGGVRAPHSCAGRGAWSARATQSSETAGRSKASRCGRADAHRGSGGRRRTSSAASVFMPSVRYGQLAGFTFSLQNGLFLWFGQWNLR